MLFDPFYQCLSMLKYIVQRGKVPPDSYDRIVKYKSLKGLDLHYASILLILLSLDL